MQLSPSGIGAFVATFTPQDWITGGLSVAAIFVSVAGYFQRERQHPKPKLTFDWTNWKSRDEHGSVAVVVRIANDGLAPCRRLRILAKGETVSHANTHATFDEIEAGREVMVFVPFRDAPRPIISVTYSHRRRPVVSKGPRKIYEDGP